MLKKAYAKSFVGSIVIVMIGIFTSTMIDKYYPLAMFHIELLQALSVIPGSTALFGSQGWNIQTWSRTTPAEILNMKLFRFFSVIGFYFAVVAFSLHSPASEFNNTDQDITAYRIKSENIQENYMQFREKLSSMTLWQ